MTNTTQPLSQQQQLPERPQPQPSTQRPSQIQKRRHKHTEEDESRRSSAKKQYTEHESPIDSSPSSAAPAAAGSTIFSTKHLSGCAPTEINYFMRILFNLSENIQCRDHTPKLVDSEAAYCHYALWPLIDLCCGAISNLQCNFKVGETILSASKQLPTYLADGTVFVNASGLELLFEASGKFGTRDRGRHSKDHIKGAYGFYTMIHAILNNISYSHVISYRSTGNDNCLRLWVMKPCFDGKIISFETNGQGQCHNQPRRQARSDPVDHLFSGK
ncbi:hypothetical protein BCR42DRAFT_398819 [Absidia repens]|uniref:Uncharacterized protein n=1 Tax=Absidia repens TaxID=90262 RepID=A0A1X2HR66_9FUNG|nr:hypothetical protein BCR42DRAFT_398819 [Absidia repens]